MLREIYAVRTLELDCSQQEVLPFIWDIKNIEYCEVKADKVRVTKETERSGTYTVEGHFARFVPWQRKFAYQLHDKGFHSTEAELPVSVFDIQGGFMVEALGEGKCQITHYEQYKLPRRFLLLKPLLVLYLDWSQRQELKDLKALIMQNLPTKALTS